MTRPSHDTFAEPLRTTGAWAVWWRISYRLLRLLGRPVMGLALRLGFANIVVLRVAGRHTGRERALPLGLLVVDGGRYVGHPDGDTGWTLNVRAASTVTVESARLPRTDFRPALLPHGLERDAVVRATFRQHPFPGNLIYRLAAAHVASTGVFFRLEPIEGRSI